MKSDTEELEEYIQEEIEDQKEQQAQEERIKREYKELFLIFSKILSQTASAAALLEEQKKYPLRYWSELKKQSHIGISSNKRLVLLAYGFFGYYSKTPKEFKGTLIIFKFQSKIQFCKDKIEDITETSKCAIKADEIQSCNPLGQQKFVVEFYKESKLYKKLISSHLILKEEIPKTVLNFEAKLTRWTFSCPTSEKRDEWVSVINRAMQMPQKILSLEDQLKKQKEEEEKAKNQVEKQIQIEAELKKLWDKRNQVRQDNKKAREKEKKEREKQERIQREKDEEEERMEQERQRQQQEERQIKGKLLEKSKIVEQKRMEEMENQLKLILEEKQNEEKQRNKMQINLFNSFLPQIHDRQEELTRRQQKSLGIPKEWMYRYLQCIDVGSSQSSPKQIIEESFIKGKFIYGLLSDFEQTSLSILKQIVDETKSMEGSEESLQFQEQTEQYAKYFTPHPHIDNNFFRLIYKDNIALKIAFTKCDSSSSSYSEQAIKHLTNEYKSLDKLNDIVIEELKKDSDFSLRTPIACLLEYSGIVALAIGIPKFFGEQQDQLIATFQNINLNEQEKQNISFSNNIKIKQLNEIRSVLSQLNLKSERDTQSSLTFMEYGVELKQLDSHEYIDLRKTENQNMEEDFSPSKLDNLFLLIKVANLFPVDVVDEVNDVQHHNKLRCEFITTINYPLNNQVYFSVERNKRQDEVELLNACKSLKNAKIMELVQKLDSLALLPLDSQQFSSCFHQYGINIRYLGRVSTLTSKNHIKSICQTEAISRICKKVFRGNQSLRYVQQPLHLFISQSSLLDHQTIQQPQYSSIFQQSQSHNNNSHICDFLNLILSSEEQTQYFWNNTIQKLTKEEFDIEIDQSKIIKGGLLQSLKYHLRIEFSFDEDTAVFEQANPVKIEQIKGFVARVRNYSMNTIEINQIGEQYESYMELGQKDLALSSVRMKLASVELVNEGRKNQQIQEGDLLLLLKEVKYLSDESEILLSFNNYEESLAKSATALEIAPIAHVCQVKSLGSILKVKLMKGENKKAIECFKRAMSIIQFQLGDTHPLQSILYSIFGYFYSQKKYYDEAIELYKNSLANSKISLGEVHQHTAEVYKDISILFTKMSRIDEALENLEKSYYIYQKCQLIDSLPFAKICSSLSILTLRQGKFEQCEFYCLKCINVLDKQSDTQQVTKQLLDSYLILCRVREIVHEYDKCLESTLMAWDLADKMKGRDKFVAYEAILKIVIQVCLPNVPKASLNLIYTLTNRIEEEIQQKRNPIDKLGWEITQYQNTMEEVVNEVSQNQWRSPGLFVKNILSLIHQNYQVIQQNTFSQNYSIFVISLPETSPLKKALKNYERLVRLLSSAYLMDVLKQF